MQRGGLGTETDDVETKGGDGPWHALGHRGLPATQRLGEAGRRLPGAAEGGGPAHTLVPDFQPPGQRDDACLL